jgi:sulfide:quinone oxidoreductase
MPIKCAGAPQKALYLSADHWRRAGVLNNIDINFYNAGGVLFGVKEYVPALMKYIEKYDAHLRLHAQPHRIDGEKKAAFEVHKDRCRWQQGNRRDNLRHDPCRPAADRARLRACQPAGGRCRLGRCRPEHAAAQVFDNIWALGDVMNAPNAKTAAAARKQAPVPLPTT